VPEGKNVENRLHLDVRAAPGTAGDVRMAALEVEAARLVGLRATRVRRVDPDGRMETGFVVVQDPEGNGSCLGRARGAPDPVRRADGAQPSSPPAVLDHQRLIWRMGEFTSPMAPCHLMALPGAGAGWMLCPARRQGIGGWTLRGIS
jgi:hypothetical protein